MWIERFSVLRAIREYLHQVRTVDDSAAVRLSYVTNITVAHRIRDFLLQRFKDNDANSLPYYYDNENYVSFISLIENLFSDTFYHV